MRPHWRALRQTDSALYSGLERADGFKVRLEPATLENRSARAKKCWLGEKPTLGAPEPSIVWVGVDPAGFDRCLATLDMSLEAIADRIDFHFSMPHWMMKE